MSAWNKPVCHFGLGQFVAVGEEAVTGDKWRVTGTMTRLKG